MPDTFVHFYATEIPNLKIILSERSRIRSRYDTVPRKGEGRRSTPFRRFFSLFWIERSHQPKEAQSPCIDTAYLTALTP